MTLDEALRIARALAIAQRQANSDKTTHVRYMDVVEAAIQYSSRCLDKSENLKQWRLLAIGTTEDT